MENPYKPPEMNPSSEKRVAKVEYDVRALGLAHKKMIFAFITCLILSFYTPLASLVYLALIIIVYLVSHELKHSAQKSILLAALMFVPLACFYVLFVLNRESAAVLRSEGVKVGMFGAVTRYLPPKEEYSKK